MSLHFLVFGAFLEEHYYSEYQRRMLFHNFKIIIDNIGSKLIGKISLISLGSVTLGNGIIYALFHADEKSSHIKEKLITCVK